MTRWYARREHGSRTEQRREVARTAAPPGARGPARPGGRLRSPLQGWEIGAERSDVVV
ncbi:MAG: hypothetical protein M5U20_11405 [Phycisphaerales bacterium]|nr:hypothetical protein [Phycisphaerales bacterium]